ncbi:MAG: DUF4398 domain-containing protein [Stellaceae bacterium]
MKSQNAKWRLGALTIFASALALAACAGPPVPTAEMRGAGDAIARAQDDGAEQLAPQALQMAQTKLSGAQADVKNDKNEEARRLAEQAEADAEYADASANAQRVTNTATELTGAQQRLQQQLQQRP